MTEIVSGTVVHWKTDPANPKEKPQFDPAGTKEKTVALDDCDDGVAAVAIVSQYISDIPDAGAAPLDQDRKQMLIDASKGLVRVVGLKRTRVPSV
jgi:hypothetical protein